MLPALCFQLKFLFVACYELRAEFWLCDVANHLHAFYLFNLLEVADRDGEEQFVVFSAV